MKPLLHDTHGIPIFPGDHVTARLQTWNGYIEIASGPVQYIEPNHTCYGCGYAIVDPQRGVTFLNTLSTSVELVKTG